MEKVLPRKQIRLNKPQSLLVTANAKESVCNWPRGVGKSTIIAYLLRKAALSMPRGVGTITGITYEQVLTRTLPSTIRALELFGWKKDVHFWIGHRPPKKYKVDLPYEPPNKFEHFITFYTGFGCHLLSQDRSTSARGLNTDIHLVDEALMIDIDLYTKDVLGTNRGNEEHFSKVNIHHGIFHFTSMPFSAEGSWIIKKSEYYDEDGHDINIVKNMIIKLQLEFLQNKNYEHRLQLHREIIEKEKLLKFYKCNRPGDEALHGLYYSEATAWDNLMNLGIGYLEKTYRDMLLPSFLIEVLGQRTGKRMGGFYPTFERDLHGYKGHYNYTYLDSLGFDFSRMRNKDSQRDLDCDPDEPLYISVDWGGNINFMVIAQLVESKNQLNFINNLYAKAPEILDDVFKKFIEYYRHHKKKRVLMFYDRNGNQKLANSKITFAEQGAAILRKGGWTVEMKSLGANPFHNEKYLLMGRIFKQQHLQDSQRDARYPIVRFNLIQCKETVISIEQAPAKEVNGEIKKDKGSESSTIIPQEEATHASDAVDNILFPLYKHLLSNIINLPTAQFR